MGMLKKAWIRHWLETWNEEIESNDNSDENQPMETILLNKPKPPKHELNPK
jgi:hypothetical protein